jgi:hypothetical protein
MRVIVTVRVMQVEIPRIRRIARSSRLISASASAIRPRKTSQDGLCTTKNRPTITGRASTIVLAYIQRHAPSAGFWYKMKKPIAVPASPPIA